MSYLSFDNQVAVITGAGRGLGRSYAFELAARGAAIVVNDIARDEHGEILADKVTQTINDSGGRAIPSLDSVSTKRGCQAIVQRALDAFSGVDIVINNAGVLRHSLFAEMTPDQLDDVLDSHVKGSFYVTQAAWPTMVERGYGRVVLTSSASGAFGKESHANYAAAKAGILGLGKVLALEGSHHGIKVNAVLPMAITTPRTGEAKARGDDNERTFRAWGRLQERREPERVTALVAYLASRECSVSGHAYSALAGRYARVFVGVTRGWAAEDSAIARPEDIRDNLAAIECADRYSIPDSLAHEIELAIERVV